MGSLIPCVRRVDTKIFMEFHGICLRSWCDSDVDPYSDLIGDARVMKFIGDGAPRNRDVARREIEKFSNEIDRRGWSRMAVSVGRDGPFVGYAGFAEINGEIDFGGRSLAAYWGSPAPMIGTILAIEYGFQKLAFPQIFASMHASNFRAIKMIKTFFGVDVVRDIETPFGVHKRIELSYEKYKNDNRMIVNRAFISNILNRRNEFIFGGDAEIGNG